MTLADYNAKRKALTRLERTGWLNTRLNLIGVFADYIEAEPDYKQRLSAYSWILRFARDIRAYRRKHKFWECR